MKKLVTPISASGKIQAKKRTTKKATVKRAAKKRSRSAATHTSLLGTPKRTNNQVIADQSVAHLSYFVSQSGFLLSTVYEDYGIDVHIKTFNSHGEYESFEIKCQLKAQEVLRMKDGLLSVRVRTDHIRMWIREQFPFFLILYVASDEEAYWIDIREYFSVNIPTKRQLDQKTLQVKIDVKSVLSKRTMSQWQAAKNREAENIQALRDGQK